MYNSDQIILVQVEICFKYSPKDRGQDWSLQGPVWHS